MRFTVVATGQFSLNRAFGFRLTASSLIQLSVVNSPIRPAGLPPAWQPASPAHSVFQRFSFQLLPFFAFLLPHNPNATKTLSTQ